MRRGLHLPSGPPVNLRRTKVVVVALDLVAPGVDPTQMLVDVDQSLQRSEHGPTVPAELLLQTVEEGPSVGIRVVIGLMDRDVVAPSDHAALVAKAHGVAFVGSHPAGLVGPFFGVLLPVPVDHVVALDVLAGDVELADVGGDPEDAGEGEGLAPGEGEHERARDPHGWRPS